jgi:hypothetical protein
MAEEAFWYAARWLTYYFVFGMALHVVDRYFGVPFYRWYYNRGQKDPADRMPITREIGFMYGRSFTRRRIWAVTISIVHSVYMLYEGHAVNLGAEFIILVFEAVVLLVGFRAGAWAYSFIRKQEGFAETVDRVGESIETTSVTEIYGRWVLGPMRRLRELVRQTPVRTETVYDVPPPADASPAPKTEAPASRPKGPSASEILQRHKDGRAL